MTEHQDAVHERQPEHRDSARLDKRGHNAGGNGAENPDRAAPCASHANLGSESACEIVGSRAGGDREWFALEGIELRFRTGGRNLLGLVCRLNCRDVARRLSCSLRRRRLYGPPTRGAERRPLYRFGTTFCTEPPGFPSPRIVSKGSCSTARLRTPRPHPDADPQNTTGWIVPGERI